MSQTEYRPEQMWAGEIMNECLPSGWKLSYEMELTNLHDVGEIKARFAKPDIVLVDSKHDTWIAIRMNGGYHMKKSQKMKDANQKIILEGNGFKVVDFNVDDMPNLFSNDRVNNRKGAYKEVIKGIQFIWE